MTVNDADPVADFSFSPSAPTIGDPVSFTDASISYDGITWEWDFDTASGSAVNGTDQNPTHTYAVAGTFTVRLTVSEADGGVSTVEKEVEVVEQPVAPTVDGGPDQTADEGATTTLAATFSDADIDDTHTASIDWGDGTPAEAGTVIAIIAFTPTSLGPNTSGSFERYFDGSDVSLGSSSDEDIYALALDATGKIYLSTKGNFSVSGVSGHDEDVFVFTPSSLGSSTAGTFAPTLFFDGSAYGLSSNDIYGIDLR